MKDLFELKNFQDEQQQDQRIDFEVKKIKKNLSKYRYQHSLEVAAIALQLWQSFFSNELPLRNQILHAALLHDFTKEWKLEKHFDIAKSHQLDFDLSCLPVALHHAFTGALAAKSIFSHEHPNILNAIRYHTTGHGDMSASEKIIYSADYLASAQISWHEIKNYSLNELVFLKAQHTLQKLIAKQLPIAKESYELYQVLANATTGKKNDLPRKT